MRKPGDLTRGMMEEDIGWQQMRGESSRMCTPRRLKRTARQARNSRPTSIRLDIGAGRVSTVCELGKAIVGFFDMGAHGGFRFSGVSAL